VSNPHAPKIRVSREAAAVEGSVRDFLAARVERNVPATLLARSLSGDVRGHAPLFAWGTEASGVVRFFAVRNHPWPLLVTEIEPDDAEALVDVWLREDPEVPGVTGVPAAARAVAEAWARRTGGSWGLRMREALHVLAEVVEPPRWPMGRLRRATWRDRELLIAWEREFQLEARVAATGTIEPEAIVERRLAAGAQFVWEGKERVSTLGVNPPIAGTVRIGPVFTPAEHRGHGYASAAVARASSDALAAGARRCMLFTDVENPTPNKIYAAIGFRRRGDWEELEFELPGPA
jgi:RimJ/RimL family protein N-acetyltransferase